MLGSGLLTYMAKIGWNMCKICQMLGKYLSVWFTIRFLIMKTSWFLVVGISNTAGTLAAIIGTVGAGFFVELVGSFPGFLLLTSFLYFLAALFYCLFSTGERVNFDDPGEYKYT